jgi:hypothetical protein
MNSDSMTFLIMILIALFTAIITIYLLNRKPQQEHFDAGASSIIQPQGTDDINSPSYIQ